MSKDYIPTKESELLSFAKNFLNKTAGSPEDFNLTSATITELEELIEQFESSYNESYSQKIILKAINKKKSAAKKILVEALRVQGQTAQKSGISNEKRTSLGLKIVDRTKTPVGAPRTFPVGNVKPVQSLRHKIRFYDSEAESKGKPKGVRGAQIWLKIGGEPTLNEEDYRYLTTATAQSYTVIFKAADIGKQAHYILRWENPKGETGAWSSVVSATVTS